MMKRSNSIRVSFIILHSSILSLIGFPIRSFGQCTHVDSVLAIRLSALLSEQVAGKPFSVAADSGFQNFVAAMPHEASAAQVVQLRMFSASVTATDFRDTSAGRVTPVLVNAEGTWIVQGNPVARSWSVTRTIGVPLTASDRLLVETNRDRYVTLERETAASFWSSIAEPALVVLGAIAIVALFFLIRS